MAGTEETTTMPGEETRKLTQTTEKIQRVVEFQHGSGVSTQSAAMKAGTVGAGGRTPMSGKWQFKEEKGKKKESISRTGTTEAR